MGFEIKKINDGRDFEVVRNGEELKEVKSLEKEFYMYFENSLRIISDLNKGYEIICNQK